MQLLRACGGAKIIQNFDYVYFSGISLAILSDEDKDSLLDLVQSLRNCGAKVAFDPNYRPKMWRDRNHATTWIQRAYQCSDIVFPGLEDHEALFLHVTREAVSDYLHPFHFSEIVIKCGQLGVYCYGDGDAPVHLPYRPAENQVDSTAAGDSFAGTYMASRMAGRGISTSVKAAGAIAAFVVQHRELLLSPRFSRNLETPRLNASEECLSVQLSVASHGK